MTSSSHGFERILVARGGAIGDFVLTLPMFQVLRSAFPKAFIEVLGYPAIASIGLVGGHADRFSRIESPDMIALFNPDMDIPRAVCDYFASFDLIISYIHDPGRVFQNQIASISNARFLVAAARPPENALIHASQFFLLPLEEIGLSARTEEPRIRPRKAAPDVRSCGQQEVVESLAGLMGGFDQRGTNPLAKRGIACHPGSGSPAKNWPLDRWMSLLSWLIEEFSATPLVVGGEADAPQLSAIQARFPRGNLELVVNEPLPQLIQRLSPCEGFIGHDSGITHLAAACGIPTIALWGPTNPDVWRPLGRKVHLVQARNGLANLDLNRVCSEVAGLFR